MSQKHIEQRHKIDVDRRILDVRPWSVRLQEKLSEPFNFSFFVALPVISISYILPFTAPLLFIVFFIFHRLVMSAKSFLPFRYPANMKGSKVAPKADGIMYVGAVREDSPFEKFKQCWLNDSDLRKHMLIMGSTGSGKTETLKGIFYNALCWGSGFFCADGKADNQLPTDGYTMCRAFGRDDDVLHLNFLLGSSTPQQVLNSKRKRTNSTNPFSSSDADTIIQMGANLLPKAEGDGKTWQEKALVVWRSVVTALCYKRDHYGFTLSIDTIIDYLALHKIEELYVEGYKEAENSDDGKWSYGYVSIKNYLDSGLPGFSVDILHEIHELGDKKKEDVPSMGRRRGQQPRQDPSANEQHGYRTGQLMPVLNLLDKTYGHIFRPKYSEIDMIDVALRNRILFMLIPSLEKSAQEAENLGKLAIASLRVMMARNLGSELEGTYDELIASKATASNYPYIVALDELGYYFADGIAVMFAQARSLGMCMLAASQDLEKLTEGSRQAEAGAMIGNTVNKIFMKIDDPEKTYKLVENTVGRSRVAQYANYEAGVGVGGVKRSNQLSVTEEVMISYQEMQQYREGEAVMNALGVTQRISTFYMGDWLEKLGNKNYHLNRFMQIDAPSPEEAQDISIEVRTKRNEQRDHNAIMMMSYLRGKRHLDAPTPSSFLLSLAQVLHLLNKHHRGLGEFERGIVIYEALKALYFSEDEDLAQVRKAAEEQSDELRSLVAAPMQDEVQRKLLDDSVDEFGLLDPLSLVRKPVQEVLEPTRDEIAPIKPRVRGEQDSDYELSEEEVDERIDKSFGSILDDQVFNRQESDDEIINQVLISGAGDQAKWLVKSQINARKIKAEPRSVDNTVVGVQESSMHELESIERSLGNIAPKAAASELQKIVAANVTPETAAKEEVTEKGIEDFFNELI